MIYQVRPITRADCKYLLLNHHYAKRVPSISFAYGLFFESELIGVITFGSPASRHLQIGVCPTAPDKVIELNRLCVLDSAPRNTASWFISRALKLLPSFIVVSYADTTAGHKGYVYRSANFNYAGWTDMERKTPRFDYIVPGKHTRDAFRNGTPQYTDKVRRKPKIKYWTITGDRREQRQLLNLCSWPCMSWREYPPPSEHLHLIHSKKNGGGL
jgi:hypothetical protein